MKWETSQYGSRLWNKIPHYYHLITQLGAIYIDTSCLKWAGQQFQGKAPIVEKLSSLPFQKIQHSMTAQDHQPTPHSCIISTVVGQPKMFLLKNINNAWVCTNDVFRLALHNFG
uniref:Nuclear transport factor 2 domain-containing protein n=1 Tax=Cercocebus atys TaxID=9531 RepID=A0A2K5MVH2_CERAT